jgi:uncharacterized membrane protein
LRRYIVAGLLVWVPIGITVLIIKFLVDLMDQTLLLLPPDWRPEHLVGYRVPGLGLVLTVLVVIATGVVVTNLFGHHLVRVGERILNRIPLVRSIYGAAKQVTETLFKGTGKSFRKVVLVEYPRKGVWTLAFQTGEATKEMLTKTNNDLINIFVPTTPNPTSGFFLMLPRQDVIELDINVDDGLKMIISAGVVVPKDKKENLVQQHTRAS